MKAFSRIIGLSLGIALLVIMIPVALGSSTPSVGPSSVRVAIDTATPPPVPTAVSALASPANLLVQAAPATFSPPPEPAPAPRDPGTFNDDLQLDMRLAREEKASQALPVATAPATDPLELFIHLPAQADKHQPLRVLLVLHGMGGQGGPFAQNLIADADRNNWVLVAPNMPYKCDYMDPVQLVQEDIRLVHSLRAMLQGLPKQLGLELHQHVLIYGFSRGAQIGHRFALFYPDEVETVATISAGSYTLPQAAHPSAPKGLPFPFGIGDLKTLTGNPFDSADFAKITFWIAVGEKDNRPGDVARAFDAYNGKTRVERARAFASALQAQGIDTSLTIFPNADHEVTNEMRQRALEFLRKDELADHWND